MGMETHLNIRVRKMSLKSFFWAVAVATAGTLLAQKISKQIG